MKKKDIKMSNSQQRIFDELKEKRETMSEEENNPPRWNGDCDCKNLPQEELFMSSHLKTCKYYAPDRDGAAVIGYLLAAMELEAEERGTMPPATLAAYVKGCVITNRAMLLPRDRIVKNPFSEDQLRISIIESSLAPEMPTDHRPACFGLLLCERNDCPHAVDCE